MFINSCMGYEAERCGLSYPTLLKIFIFHSPIGLARLELRKYSFAVSFTAIYTSYKAHRRGLTNPFLMQIFISH